MNYAEALRLNPRHKGAHGHVGEAYFNMLDPSSATVNSMVRSERLGYFSLLLNLKRQALPPLAMHSW